MCPQRIRRGTSHQPFSPALQCGTITISHIRDRTLFAYISDESPWVYGPENSLGIVSDPHHGDEDDDILERDSQPPILVNAITLFRSSEASTIQL